jgi:hypothetical protein
MLARPQSPAIAGNLLHLAKATNLYLTRKASFTAQMTDGTGPFVIGNFSFFDWLSVIGYSYEFPVAQTVPDPNMFFLVSRREGPKMRGAAQRANH